MKAKRKILFVVTLITIISIPYFIKLWYSYKDDHFSCWGGITFQRDDLKYSVQVKYLFKGGEGELFSLGEYSKSGENIKNQTQHLKFNYYREKNVYVMISTQSLLTESQAKYLDSFVPDFYLYKDRGIRIKIYTQGTHNLVFTTAEIPIFICTIQ